MGLSFGCWAHVVGILGGENVYLGSSIIIINYPTLSTAIGEKDGMDGSRAHWMMLPFWEVPSKLILGSGILLGSMGLVFNRKKRVCY